LRKRLLPFILFASLFILADKVHGASTQYIKVYTNTPIYDFIADDRVRVGTLLSGQTFPLLHEDENYYYIQFGNDQAFLEKNHKVELINQAVHDNDDTARKNSQSTVITTRQTVVYNSISSNQKGFAIINTNIRYPIVSVNGNWLEINFGNRRGYIHKKNVIDDYGVPVLMYHHMLRDEENKMFKNNSMVISVNAFEEQMQYLHKQKYRTIHLQELEDYLNKRANLVGKIAVITFDDGLLSSAKYAYPILKKYKFKATQFLIVSRIRLSETPFDPDSLQYFSAITMKNTSDVFDFQHHTYNMHLRNRETNVPFLIEKSFEEIQADFMQGQQVIGKHHKGAENVKYLAYPWGQYDEKTIQAAKSVGITMAFTTETGNVKIGDEPFLLKRQGIGPRHSMDDFIKKLNGTYTEQSPSNRIYTQKNGADPLF
jgi:peptidoglycan/xylan/chitin deacetylase (PgdA/CDA1 family)